MSYKILGKALFRLKPCTLFCYCLFGNAKATLKFNPAAIVKKTDLWACLNIRSSRVFNESMTIDGMDIAKCHNPVTNAIHQFCGKVCLRTEPGDKSAHGCIVNEDDHLICVVKEKNNSQCTKELEDWDKEEKKTSERRICRRTLSSHPLPIKCYELSFPKPVLDPPVQATVFLGKHVFPKNKISNGHRINNVEPIVVKHSWKNTRCNFAMLANRICRTKDGAIVGAHSA